jgi:hypothetical protein
VPIAAKRTFRLGLTVSLALALGYGLGLSTPFMAPLFALMLTVPPGPPMPAGKLMGLVFAVVLILGVGLLLIRPLEYYPLSAVLLVTCGVFLASYLSVNLGKGGPATLLIIALTLISSIGTQSWAAAVLVIQSLVIGVVLAILCQWTVYPFFPETSDLPPPEPPVTAEQNNWIALRATAVIMPVFLLTLTNPTAYAPLVMKSVSLGQQASSVTARSAGGELLGSTFLGGCFAVLIWFGLGISTNLWMFFLWTLLFVTFLGGRIYQAVPSRFPASFWSNVGVTAIILLGSAVQDTDSGKDVYQAFAVRLGLFIAVTLYAWFVIELLERWRTRRQSRSPAVPL